MESNDDVEDESGKCGNALKLAVAVSCVFVVLWLTTDVEDVDFVDFSWDNVWDDNDVVFVVVANEIDDDCNEVCNDEDEDDEDVLKLP